MKTKSKHRWLALFMVVAIFKSMNQTKVADFSVFKPKKKNPVATEEQKEAVAEQNPVPQKESVAGRMTEKTVPPIKE